MEAYAGERGLMCSPQKSELLDRPPGKRRRPAAPDIQLTLHDRIIPIVPCIRVRGLRIHQSASNTDTIKALSASSLQVSRRISLIAHRHNGLKVRNLIRLGEAFTISRITYVTP